MTCTEVRAFIRRNPDHCTGSEIVAFGMHCFLCPECDRYVNKCSDQFVANNPVEYQHICVSAKKRVVAALRDSEIP
jgi:hypothetical protein